MRKSWKLVLTGLGLLTLTAGIIAGLPRLRDRAAEIPRAGAPAPISPDLPKSEPPPSSTPPETPRSLTPAPASPDLSASEPPLPSTPAVPSTPKLPEPQPIESEVVRLLEGPLKEWVASWKPAAPDFNLTQLRKVLEEPLVEDWEAFEMQGLDPRRRPLYVFSPDESRFMDPYSSMELVEKDGRLIPAFDVDQSVTLYDIKTSREMRLAFCGTACGVDDGIWLSNDAIAVVGTSMDWACQSSQCSWGPMVIVFDFSRKTESIYVGPNIDTAQRLPYFSDRLKQRLPEITFK